MQYLLQIWTSEAAEQDASPEEQNKVIEEYMAFTRDIREAGQLVAGDALQPTTTATTVRVRDGKTLTTDGPFAETKEQLGGYYIVECKDLDEAVEVAGRIPGARVGSIEVRPLMVFE